MNHFSHPQHKLSFVYSERLFKCDGCGQVGIGIRFNCSHCNFDLHTHCAAANPATAPLRHHFYPDCLFNFLACPPGDSRRYCDACGKDIVGFVYHCRKWGYDLHPCCAALPHEHHIDGGLRLRLHSRASAPCDWCSQMGKSWCYRSDCNKYNLHVACAMDLSIDSPHELLNGGGGSRRGGGCHSEGSGGGSGGRESDRGGRSRGRGGGGGRGGGRGDGGGGDGGSVGRGGNRSDGGRGGSSGDRMAILLENRIPRSRGGGGVGRDSGGGSRGNGRGHGDQDRNRGNHGDGSGGGRRGGGKRGDGGRGRGGHDGDQSNRGGGRGDGSVSGDGSHSSGSGGHGADRGGRGRGRGSGGRGVGSRRGDRGHGSGSHGGDRAEGGGGSSHDEGGGGRGSNGGVIRSVGNNHHGGKVKKLCKLAAVVGHFVIAAVLGDPSAMIVGVVSALLSQ